MNKDQGVDFEEQEYFHEVVILILVASLLFLVKICVCCQTLGLSQKYRQANQRKDPLSQAEYFNLKTVALSQDSRRENRDLEPLPSGRRSIQTAKKVFKDSSSQTVEKQLSPILLQNLLRLSPYIPTSNQAYTGEQGQIVQVHFSSASQAN